MTPRRPSAAWIPFIVIALVTCAVYGLDSARSAVAAPEAATWRWQLPKGFPKPRVPADNRMSAAKVAIGRRLFYDERLSGNGTQSCSSCHRPELAFSDGRIQPVGSTGELHPRNAPSLFNAAYNTTLTWANPALVTLEAQMEVPLFGDAPVEMGITDADKPRILSRLRRDAWYAQRFRHAFPKAGTHLSWTTIVRSIAAFQRTMISGDRAMTATCGARRSCRTPSAVA